jgi:hypothetical protein
MRIGVVHIGVRTHRGEELGSVQREDQIAGPVAAAAQPSAAGQIGQMLLGVARLQIAIFVREANDAVGIADINPLGIGPGGIKSDAEGLMQAVGKNRNLFCFVRLCSHRGRP